MKLTLDLTTRETNIILNALAGDYHRVRKSKAKSWTTSTKVMTMSELADVRNKIVRAELEAHGEAEAT